jgi:hypothetical protein
VIINEEQKLRLSLGSRLGSSPFYEPQAQASGYRVQEPRLDRLRLEALLVEPRLRLRLSLFSLKSLLVKF